MYNLCLRQHPFSPRLQPRLVMMPMRVCPDCGRPMTVFWGTKPVCSWCPLPVAVNHPKTPAPGRDA